MPEQNYPFIIALVGARGSGKTTLAKALASLHPCSLRRHSFAQPIREMLRAIVPEEHLRPEADKNLPLDELQGKTMRQALTTLGTEWGRDTMGPGIWTGALLRNLRNGKSIRGVVIDDMRFLSEAQALRDVGAVIVRIGSSPSACERDTPITAPEPRDGPHQSEAEWERIKWDYLINNDGSPQRVACEIMEMVIQAMMSHKHMNIDTKAVKDG